jgi:hypothetical protein
MAGRKLGSRRRPTRCRIARLQLFVFVDSCLSNQFALSGKRYAVREDLPDASHQIAPGMASLMHAAVRTTNRSSVVLKAGYEHDENCATKKKANAVLGPRDAFYPIAQVATTNSKVLKHERP